MSVAEGSTIIEAGESILTETEKNRRYLKRYHSFMSRKRNSIITVAESPAEDSLSINIQRTKIVFTPQTNNSKRLFTKKMYDFKESESITSTAT